MRAALIAGAGFLGFAGCSALVTTELDNVSCTQENTLGPPACPVGSACHGGKCVACAPKDICGNGIDDDCNGEVDEGCKDSGGAAGGGAPQGGFGGVAGTLAGGASGGIAGGGGVAGVPAGGGTGGTGATLGRLGEGCQDNTQCVKELFCTSPSKHGATDTNQYCAKQCCKSEDCLGQISTVCYPAVGGYGICLPAASVGRPEPGAQPAGAPCSAPTECRSAACQGTCIDYCCRSGDCPAPLACTIQPIPGASDAFACGLQPGPSGLQNLCNSPDNCQSGLCIFVSATSNYKCTIPCCRQTDCGTWRCAYATVNNEGVRVCAPGAPDGPNANGSPCQQNSDCKSGWCITLAGTKMCSDACCQDADCGNGLLCRPGTTDSGQVFMICRPPQ